MAQLLEGKVVAEAIRAQLKERVAALKLRGVVPGLSVTLVGEDPASQTYVAAKDKAAHEVGLDAWTHRFPATMTQDELLAHVRAQNADAAVHGILVQMPLPKGLDSESVLTAIDPAKDADGFHPFNVGCLSIGRPAPVSCTPAGVIEILRHYKLETRGKRAVVIGRSNIVGKPMAALLMRQDPYGDATVTVAHSRTANLPEVVREADIVIAAIGRPEFVKGDWIKPGAVVVDVGVNRVDDASKARGYRLVGDVEFEAASRVASAITPVPGGVGPMTITMLLSNTVAAAERAAGLAPAT